MGCGIPRIAIEITGLRDWVKISVVMTGLKKPIGDASAGFRSRICTLASVLPVSVTPAKQRDICQARPRT